MYIAGQLYKNSKTIRKHNKQTINFSTEILNPNKLATEFNEKITESKSE